MEIKKIAVVRTDRIGDLILTTPAIASLKALYPGCHLTAIVSSYNQVVLENSPDVDEIWPWKWSLKNILRLRKKHFDLVAVFSPTTQSYLIAFFSGAKLRAGYVYKSRILTRFFSCWWLNRRLVCSTDQKEVQTNQTGILHEVEQNLEVVQALGAPREKLRRDLVVPVAPADLHWAKQVLQDKPALGVHWSEALQVNLPPDFFVELLVRLTRKINVFITAGPYERAGKFGFTLPETIKWFENLPFSRWAALFRQSQVIVTGNTGAVHLAASQGVPVVAVFDSKFYPYHRMRWSPWKVPFFIFRKDDPDLLQKITEGAFNLAGLKENIGSNLQL